MRRTSPNLRGQRVLITGGARGIGSLLARRLFEGGAQVALVGLEPQTLAQVAAECGDAPWRECDVTDRAALTEAVDELVAQLGGLDVLVANAGIASGMAMIGGDPQVWDKIIDVNLTGAFNTAHVGGPHISHPGGYLLLVSSAAALVQLPLLGAYSASKAGVEALANTLRIELRPSGAKVGLAYFGELDTEMTARGFGSDAAQALTQANPGLHRVAPVEVGIDALTRAIGRRSRTTVAPVRFRPLVALRVPAQWILERLLRRGVSRSLAIAQREPVRLTTAQPDQSSYGAQL